MAREERVGDLGEGGESGDVRVEPPPEAPARRVRQHLVRCRRAGVRRAVGRDELDRPAERFGRDLREIRRGLLIRAIDRSPRRSAPSSTRPSANTRRSRRRRPASGARQAWPARLRGVRRRKIVASFTTHGNCPESLHVSFPEVTRTPACRDDRRVAVTVALARDSSDAMTTLIRSARAAAPDVRRRDRRGAAGALPAAAPAGAAARPADRDRRRQGVGGDGARGRGPLAGRARRASSSPATATRVPCGRIEIVEAAHPVPDAAGHRRGATHPATGRRGSRADDLVLCLISGGGSALLRAAARQGSRSPTSRRSTGRCCKSGATHRRDELRAQASVGDQGRPARRRRHPAQVVTLLISDVPGDDPTDIASGPTVADPTTCADALAILARYGIDVPPAVPRAARRAATARR